MAATAFLGCPAVTFTGVAHIPAGDPAALPQPSELHRCLIRTGLAARVAYLIGVGGMATATRGISVESVIQGDDQHPITMDIDIARSRTRPGEVHRLTAMHLVAARSEGDLPRCGCRCRCCCRCRGRSC